MSHRCPRRDENPGSDARFPGPDEYKDGRGLSNSFSPGCTYCGSISGDAFMEYVRAGGKVGGSDKNYKAYLEKETGVPAEVVHETVPTSDGGRNSYDVTFIRQGTGTQHAKFYYQHLSDEQKDQFVELLNERKVNHSIYVLPYFVRPAFKEKA